MFVSELCAVCGQKVMQLIEQNDLCAKKYLLGLTMKLVSTTVGAEAFSHVVDLTKMVENSLRTADEDILKIVNMVMRNCPTPISWLTDTSLAQIGNSDASWNMA